MRAPNDPEILTDSYCDEGMGMCCYYCWCACPLRPGVCWAWRGRRPYVGGGYGGARFHHRAGALCRVRACHPAGVPPRCIFHRTAGLAGAVRRTQRAKACASPKFTVPRVAPSLFPPNGAPRVGAPDEAQGFARPGLPAVGSVHAGWVAVHVCPSVASSTCVAPGRINPAASTGAHANRACVAYCVRPWTAAANHALRVRHTDVACRASASRFSCAAAMPGNRRAATQRA